MTCIESNEEEEEEVCAFTLLLPTTLSFPRAFHVMSKQRSFPHEPLVHLAATGRCLSRPGGFPGELLDFWRVSRVRITVGVIPEGTSDCMAASPATLNERMLEDASSPTFQPLDQP